MFVYELSRCEFESPCSRKISWLQNLLIYIFLMWNRKQNKVHDETEKLNDDNGYDDDELFRWNG